MHQFNPMNSITLVHCAAPYYCAQLVLRNDEIHKTTGLHNRTILSIGSLSKPTRASLSYVSFIACTTTGTEEIQEFSQVEIVESNCFEDSLL